MTSTKVLKTYNPLYQKNVWGTKKLFGTKNCFGTIFFVGTKKCIGTKKMFGTKNFFALTRETFCKCNIVLNHYVIQNTDSAFQRIQMEGKMQYRKQKYFPSLPKD